VSSEEDIGYRLSAQSDLAWMQAVPKRGGTRIVIDESKTYQTMVGLGSSLEHSTCYNLSRLSEERQDRVLRRLLSPIDGIGMNLMRICFGTSDFTASPWYSYDDVPAGEEDPEFEHFTIEKDREYVLPVLKRALRIEPELKFFASPWSPPAWMKTSDDLCGGRIDRRYFRSFAHYLARSVEAYQREGIDLLAVTPQNEPEYYPDSYPTCGWTAEEQRDFVRDHLGPVFAARKLSTWIWIYDHNFNHPQFPSTILSDPEAARYVDGSAWHLYEGDPQAMSLVHERFPDKHVYFTEGSTFGIQGAAEVVSYLRNWARCYNAWVTMIDHRAQPNPGPHDCSPTCIVLNSDTLELEYRFDYFMYGHFTKFIRPGALRIGSSAGKGAISTVAFRNPDGSRVVVVVNSGRGSQRASLEWKQQTVEVELQPKSLATVVWTP
jgi:glucosylceramidase